MCAQGLRASLPRVLHRTLAKQPKRAFRLQAQAGLTACRLCGVGSSVPATVLSNDDLSDMVETNDEWIATRTGIRNRHVLAAGETLTDHAVSSAKNALEMAGLAAEDVDMVLLATSSPDDVFGSATQVLLHLRSLLPIHLDCWCLGSAVCCP